VSESRLDASAIIATSCFRVRADARCSSHSIDVCPTDQCASTEQSSLAIARSDKIVFSVLQLRMLVACLPASLCNCALS